MTPQGDDDLLTVHIGEIFLAFVNMLPAFQTYCLQQSTSVNMLNSLEKEKELLRYTPHPPRFPSITPPQMSFVLPESSWTSLRTTTRPCGG